MRRLAAALLIGSGFLFSGLPLSAPEPQVAVSTARASTTALARYVALPA